jgi:hypothetical protein
MNHHHHHKTSKKKSETIRVKDYFEVCIKKQPYTATVIKASCATTSTSVSLSLNLRRESSIIVTQWAL